MFGRKKKPEPKTGISPRDIHIIGPRGYNYTLDEYIKLKIKEYNKDALESLYGERNAINLIEGVAESFFKDKLRNLMCKEIDEFRSDNLDTEEFIDTVVSRIKAKQL